MGSAAAGDSLVNSQHVYNINDYTYDDESIRIVFACRSVIFSCFYHFPILGGNCVTTWYTSVQYWTHLKLFTRVISSIAFGDGSQDIQPRFNKSHAPLGATSGTQQLRTLGCTLQNLQGPSHHGPVRPSPSRCTLSWSCGGFGAFQSAVET